MPAKCHQPAVQVARTHFQWASSVLVVRAIPRTESNSNSSNGGLALGSYRVEYNGSSHHIRIRGNISAVLLISP